MGADKLGQGLGFLVENGVESLMARQEKFQPQSLLSSGLPEDQDLQVAQLIQCLRASGRLEFRDEKLCPDRWLNSQETYDYIGPEDNNVSRAIASMIRKGLLFAKKEGRIWQISSLSCVLRTHRIPDPRIKNSETETGVTDARKASKEAK